MKKEKLKKIAKESFIVENEKSSPKWRIKFPHCTCAVNGLDDCIHCRYQKAVDSVPRSSYTINIKNQKDELEQVSVKGVQLVYGKNDNVLGWKVII